MENSKSWNIRFFVSKKSWNRSKQQCKQTFTNFSSFSIFTFSRFFYQIFKDSPKLGEISEICTAKLNVNKLSRYFRLNENIVIVKGDLCKNITNFSCMVFDKFVKQEMTKKSSNWCDSNFVELSRFISQFDFFSPKSKYMSKTCLDTRLRKIIEFFLQMVVNLVNQNSTVTPLLQDEWIFLCTDIVLHLLGFRKLLQDNL